MTLRSAVVAVFLIFLFAFRSCLGDHNKNLFAFAISSYYLLPISLSLCMQLFLYRVASTITIRASNLVLSSSSYRYLKDDKDEDGSFVKRRPEKLALAGGVRAFRFRREGTRRRDYKSK